MEPSPQTPPSTAKAHYFSSQPQAAIEEAYPIKRVASPYQLVEIMRHPQYGNMLVIDNDLQIAESDHIYGQTMVAPLKTTCQTQRVLIMGGGDGGVLQELLKAADSFGWLLQEAYMVDIDEVVIESCREHMPKLNAGAFNDRRAKVMLDDVFSYIKKCQNLDAVIYDLTMTPVRDGQSQAAFIEETLTDIATALKPNGILSMQCCGEGKTGPFIGDENDKLMAKIRLYVDKLFTDRQEQAVAIPSYNEKWTFLSARKRENEKQ